MVEEFYDVIVVGGCTAGIYFAKRMAEQGYSVLVVEKDPEEKWGRRLDIFHLDKECFGEHGIERPLPGDPVLVQEFTHSISKSALDRCPKNLYTEVSVMHLPLFVRRLRPWAEQQGVQFRFGAEFLRPCFGNDGRINGAAVRCGSAEREIGTRLLADCSGIASAVRTRLPAGYGVETFPIGPMDKYHVVLHYVRLDDPQKDRVRLSTSWPYYKTWTAPSTDPAGAIFGVGANGSYEQAEANYQAFLKAVKLPKHRLERIEKGSVPARRPPYSFVADGFVVLGDAACITKPWNGEGIAAHWKQCEIAAQVFGEAMQNGAYPACGRVWAMNTRYAAAQGAYFAQRFAAQSGALDTTPEENDYEFENSIIFKGDDEKEQADIGEQLKAGIEKGRLSRGAVQRLMTGFTIGEELWRHYNAFPENMEGFGAWTEQAEALWAQVDKLRKGTD